MAQATKNTSDSEDWSRGQGSFSFTSKSTITNRRADVHSKTHQGGGIGSDSDTKLGNRAPYPVYRNEDDVPFQDSKDSTAIHVDVRPSYPAVDVPIQRIATNGHHWSVSGEQRNFVYPNETLIVSPPTVRGSARQQHRTIRQGSETRVLTKMTIPQLEYPTLGRPRNQRSYSTDLIQEHVSPSQGRNYYEQSTLNNPFRQMNLQEPASRSQTPGRRKKDNHHHHCRCCNHAHCRIRSNSRSRARDLYGTVRGIPVPYEVPTSLFSLYPERSANFAPLSPAAFYYPDEYATPIPGVPYLASPAIPIHHSLPYRYHPPPVFGLRPGIPTSGIPTMTPGTVNRFIPAYPKRARGAGQYHCMCCPNGAHQGTMDKNAHVFTFESDQWESDGLAPLNQPPYGRNTHTRHTRSKQYHAETQRMQATFEGGRKSRQTPTEFEIPIQKDAPAGLNYGLVSPRGTLNETAYMSQKFQNTWNTNVSPKAVGLIPLVHGEVTRDDGFPTDYVDLIDVGIEYTNGVGEGKDRDNLPPPDKKVVIQLAEAALATAAGPSQVAATLKKSMDENFGPVWHVIAGTGAYGSNIASLGGQLLHFKAFGWAFLIWKTSDQQPE